MDVTKARVGRSGWVRYWSVYEQRWVEWVEREAKYIEHRELAAMTSGTRERIVRAREKQGGEQAPDES